MVQDHRSLNGLPDTSARAPRAVNFQPAEEGQSSGGDDSYYSLILDRSATEVWDTVRQFNSYPIWVNGVDDSHIEDGLSGTTVGAIRNFSMGGSDTRQRLLAHSDAACFFSYESCSPLEIRVPDTVRTLLHYKGTLQLTPIVEGDRCVAQWSAEYQCPHEDAEYWAEWWTTSLPMWLTSLRDHVSGERR